MNNRFYSLMVLCYIFHMVYAGIFLTKFQVHQDIHCFRNASHQQAFKKENIASVGICASECTSDDGCLGILYQPEQNVCVGCSALISTSEENVDSFMVRGSSVSINLPENQLPTEAANSSTNQPLTEAANSSTLLDFLRRGDECQTNENCTDNFSTCLDGYCNCLVEYSFDPVSEVCTPNCTWYGATYIAHPETYYDADTFYVSNHKTALDCSLLCSNTTACRGFSHSPTYDVGGWCSTQASTPRTVPGNYYNSGNNFTYYLRNCATL